MKLIKINNYNNFSVREATKQDPEFAYYADLLKEKEVTKKHSYEKPRALHKTSEDRIGSFAVILDNPYNANNLLNLALDNGLTVVQNTCYWSTKGVENANLGDIILFFVDKGHDITWTKKASYSVSNNIRPVLTFGQDYTEIKSRILKAAKEKKTLVRNLPKFRVYRELKAIEVLEEQRQAEAAKRTAKIEVVSSTYRTDKVRVQYIDMCPNFIQCGTEIYFVNPNDRFYVL